MAPISAPDGRTLAVYCSAGLGNRLRVLISAQALAEATGRQLKLFWPRTSEAGASFAELFENELEASEAEPVDIKSWPAFGGWFDRPLPDLLCSNEAHLRISTSDWLLQPARYPAHAAHLPRCADFLAGLRPIAYVRGQVQAFQAAHFRPQMIGVHLRRGDFRRAHPGSAANTTSALAAVAGLMQQLPEAGILLCTDDGALDSWTGQPWRDDVWAQLTRAFGERVVATQPRSLDRLRPEAVQDALIDLLLLRQTQALVGTAYSTFSEMAAFGRPAPWLICGARPTPAGAGLRRLSALIGLDRVYHAAVMRRFGRHVPARLVFMHLTSGPRGWLRDRVQRHWPALYQWVRARRGLPPARP